MPNTYKPQQIETADRMMSAISKIETPKQPLFAAMMECMLLGVDMAQMGPENKPQPQDMDQREV